MASGADHFDDLLRRAQRRVGSTVDGKWKLEALIGVGGMAAVYAGTHRNGKRGAVKILHPDEALDPTVKTRFLREGFVANKVGHSGIASVLDDDEAPDGTVYLVMELLEGESLETRCPPGETMAAGDVLSIANQILDVLAAAHENGIIHRDLKPSNLFLLPDGTLKVLDFGIARLREISHAESQSTESQRAPSTTLSMLGTPGFMPPEQARGRWEQVDERSDIWAVGATMFVLLTGKLMHRDDVPINEQLLAAMTEPCPPTLIVALDAPPVVADIIDRALAFSPADRWPNALSMQAAVRDAYRSLTGRALSYTGGRTTGMRVSMPDVDPGLASAPTLSASPTPNENLMRASSSRAALVVDGGKPSPPTTPKWIGIALLGAGACIVIYLFAFARSSSSAAPAPQANAAPSSVSPPAPTSATLMEAPTTSAAASVSAASSSSSVSAAVSAAKPPPTHRKSGAAPSASPSNDVDIFNRRR